MTMDYNERPRRSRGARSPLLRGLFAGDRRGMVAGLVDAATSSLATFMVGLYAVRELDPVTLGGYALAYQAVFLVGIAPAYLILTPAEVAVTAHPAERRLGYLRRTVALGTPLALAAGIASALWVLVAPGEIDADALRALTVTSVAAAFLSPIQDHVRHMLHAGNRSWRAATVSIVQLVVALIAVGAGSALGISPVWIPFGALAVANLVSLAFGLVSAGSEQAPSDDGTLRLRKLVQSGRWIFSGSIMNPAAGFAAAALVSYMAGAEALGYAEAARVVAQPVWVLAVGLSFVLAPRSMEAARQRDPARARAIARTFATIIAVAGLGCVALFGGAWAWNPLLILVPAAYVVPWLTLLTILAQIANGLFFPQRSELLGAGREEALTKVELTTSVARVMVSASARATGAYAMPLGYLAVGVLRGVSYSWLLGKVYRKPGPAPG